MSVRDPPLFFFLSLRLSFLSPSLSFLRNNKWQSLSSSDLVPGDVFSLSTAESGGERIIPCDALILKGNAVVNESTLTGESIPQLKESMVYNEGEREKERALDMGGRDRMHVLFSGTLLLQGGPDAYATTLFFLRLLSFFHVHFLLLSPLFSLLLPFFLFPPQATGLWPLGRVKRA